MMSEFADISELYKEMKESGFQPMTLLEKFEQVEAIKDIPPSVFVQLRKMIPSLIAQELVSVQPMSSDEGAGKAFKEFYEYLETLPEGTSLVMTTGKE